MPSHAAKPVLTIDLREESSLVVSIEIFFSHFVHFLTMVCYDVVKLSVSEVVLESKIYLLKMSVHFDIERACDE